MTAYAHPTAPVAPGDRAAPRLLYLCPEPPWRLNAGGAIRNYWLIRALARSFRVDVVTGDDGDPSITGEFLAACGAIRRYSRPPSALRLVRALAPGRPLYTTGCVSGPLRADVARSVTTGRYAAVMLDLCMIGALPPSCAAPLVYNAHNCESVLLARRSQHETSASRRFLTGLDARRLRTVEAALTARAALVAACSSDDVEDLAALSPGVRDKAVIVPNGVDGSRYRDVAAARPDPRIVLVTGSFDWVPNRLGLRWFLDEVVPALVGTAGGPLRVRVAGRMDAQLAATLNAIPGVSAAPNVPDMRPELARAAVVAAPILFSSGTRLRVLEAWAAGRPVVTTTAGAAGLDHTDGADIVIRDRPDAFAGAIREVLADAALRDRLRNGGLLSAARYDWREIGEKLTAAAGRLIRRGASVG